MARVTAVITYKLKDINLSHNVSLKNYSMYRCGGSTKYLFVPESNQELIEAITCFSAHKVPIMTVGEGTNILFSDNGWPGVVIQLSHENFKKIEVDQDTLICGAGSRNGTVAERALKSGIHGFEYLCGFPGSVGGGVYGNAGNNLESFCAMLEWVHAIDFNGNEVNLEREKIDYSYRQFSWAKEKVIYQVALKGREGDKTQILENMQRVKESRRQKDPKGYTCGSVFRNPKEMHAWEVVDKLGFRGKKYGGAQVSEKHPNWIINIDKACSSDIYELALAIKKKAKEKMNIDLVMEIQLKGKFLKK